jgi:hypothetical protein
VRRLVLLGLGAVVYVLAAWAVSPGFYDGLAPPAPYHWVSPPPDLRSTNKPPDSGQVAVAVKGGATQSGHVATADSQASLSFPSQSFEVPADGSQVTVAVRPAVVTLRYVQLQPSPPTQIFAAAGPAGPWRALPSVNTAVPFSVAGSAQSLGYFVVGYPPAQSPTPAGTAGSGGQSIPTVAIVVVVAVGLTVLAGLPLIVSRRRQASTPSLPATSRPVRNLGGARRRSGRRTRR